MKLGHRGDAGVPQDCTPSSARTLTSWYRHNNLQVNVSKTKELMVGYRRQQGRGHAPYRRDGGGVSSFRFLSVNIGEDLTAGQWILIRTCSFNILFLLRLSYSGGSLRPEDFSAVVESHIYGLGVKISVGTDSVFLMVRR